MKIICISDVHAAPNESSYDLLLSFLDNIESQNCSQLFLLGDVFDFMIGDFDEYRSLYPAYFLKIKSIMDKGIEIYIFEGNHDFHLEQIYKRFDSKINYIKDSLKIKIGQKTFLFQHGDIVDKDNESYLRWKKIYTSSIFSFIISHLFPFNFLVWLGVKVSGNSKKRGKKIFNKNSFKNKYRLGAQSILREFDVDYLICGHTHIQEMQKMDHGTYVNIGYPLTDNNYLYIDENTVEFRLIK